GVETAVGVVPGQAEVPPYARAAGHTGAARGHDLAVGLERHAGAELTDAGEVGSDFAAGAEGRVEAAVGVVPGQGEILDVVLGIEDGPQGPDPPVGLDRNAAPPAAGRAWQGGAALAAAAEAGVEAAVRVVTGQDEALPRGHDLAIGLDGQALGLKAAV